MKRELKNGLFHMGGAIIALAPAALHGDWASWLWAGFFYGWVREFTEEQLKHPLLHPSQAAFDALFSWRDILGWALGGLAIGLASQ